MKRHRRHHTGCSRVQPSHDGRADAAFSDDEPALVQRMAAIGMKKETAIWLLEVYGVPQAQRQLDWLPYYLRAAIEDDWQVPPDCQTFPLATKEAV